MARLTTCFRSRCSSPRCSDSLEREQGDVIAFLREENRTLKAQLTGRRLQLDDAQRRAQGACAVARTRHTARRGDACHARHHAAMASRTDRAEIDPHQAATRPTGGARRDSASGPADGDGESELGYTHSGGLKNMGHRMARSTIPSILKAEGIPPSRERPTTCRTFLRAHWPALVAADFSQRRSGPLADW